MKKITFLALFLFLATCAMSQNFEYGKASPEEMDLTRYDKDTSANAVVLNEFGKANIEQTSGSQVRLVYEYHVKIKIFDHKGFPNGTVEIHLRNNEDNSVSDEVNNIEGITSYKDDNGVTQVAELDKKKIYTTRDYKYQSTMKFAMPGLHDGCVIEYRYIYITPFFDHFHSWQFQGPIPKMYSEYYAQIPGFWHYNIALRGPLKLTKESSDIESNCFSAGSSSSGCLVLDYAMKDIPAFVVEEYMTAPRNFLSALNFDLVERTNLYTGVKTRVTAEWSDVDNQLKISQGFGTQLKKTNLVKDHLPPDILRVPDSLEKAKAIYHWTQKWFKWNNYTGVYSDDGIKKAIEMHSGSIADINITLIDALNAAWIKTEAVLLSTRDHGIINKLYPVIGDFNYLVAGANIADKSYFLDASEAFLPFGILEEKCLNDQGRVFSLDKPSFWTDMDTRQIRSNTYALDLTLQDDGTLKGTYDHYSKGYAAYLKRKAIKGFNTPGDYIDNMSDHLRKIKISKSNISGLDSLDEPISEHYEIEVNVKNNLDNEKLSLNPYLFDKISINPFKLKERNYPVDMGMPSENRYILTIHLPANYVVEAKPHDQALALSGQGGRFLSIFDANGNTITFSNVIQFNRSVYQPEGYAGLKEFYNKIILAEKEEFVFRKK